MANYWGRSGAPMIQPTKDELRQWLSNARAEAREERAARRVAESELRTARQLLGALVLDGRIAIPAEKLGEFVIRMAADDPTLLEAPPVRRLLSQD